MTLNKYESGDSQYVKPAYFKQMKRLFQILYFCLLFFPKISTAQEAHTLLQQAADAYANGDYQTAISQYEQIIVNGQHAFQVYYNLGNAYFKNNQIAPAILNYERAARINPADTDLQHNLAMAKSRTVDKVDMLAVPEFVTGYKSFVNATPADRWGAYSIAAFLLMLIAIATFLYFSKKWIKQVTLGSGILMALLAIIFFIFGWQQSTWLNSRKEAIIFQPSITVTSTPDSTGEELFVLHEGTKVRIVERFRNWVRIRIGDGNTGWVPEEAAKEI